jgi:hypothetical protein
MKLPDWLFMPEWARNAYREYLQDEMNKEHKELIKRTEQSLVFGCKEDKNNMKTKFKLKPCPFCGQSGAIELLSNNQYYPRCTGGSGKFCLLTRRADPENDGFLNYEDAVEAWNMRKKLRQTVLV